MTRAQMIDLQNALLAESVAAGNAGRVDDRLLLMQNAIFLQIAILLSGILEALPLAGRGI